MPSVCAPERTEQSQAARGTRVAFRIRDICVPEPAEILASLHGDSVLHGEIVDLTDSGRERRAFAVVEVEELGQCVIVPIACLEGVPTHNATHPMPCGKLKP